MTNDNLLISIKALRKQFNIIADEKQQVLNLLDNNEKKHQETVEQLKNVIPVETFLNKSYIIARPKEFGTIKELKPISISDLNYVRFISKNNQKFIYSEDYPNIQITDLSGVFKFISNFQPIDTLSPQENFETFFKPGHFVIFTNHNSDGSIFEYIIAQI